VVAQRSHERFRRVAHGFFVIDNRNQYLRHKHVSGVPFGGSAGVVSQPLTPFRTSVINERYAVPSGIGNPYERIAFVGTGGRFLQAGAWFDFHILVSRTITSENMRLAHCYSGK
jgi:hypothetical protein